MLRFPLSTFPVAAAVGLGRLWPVARKACRFGLPNMKRFYFGKIRSLRLYATLFLDTA
jgi:hypothetical protein